MGLFRFRESVLPMVPALCWGLFPTPASAQTKLTATKDLTISAERNNLSEIRTLAVSAKGIIAIAQPQDRSVRFFDAAGKPSGMFGRNGEGPGEFRTVVRIGWIGDTLWVYDRVVNRMTLIGPNLKLLRIHALPLALAAPVGSPVGSSTYHRLLIDSPLGRGDFLGSVVPIDASPPPSWLKATREETPLLVRVDLDGHLEQIVLRTTKHTSNCLQVVNEPGTSRSTSFGIPFCTMPFEGRGDSGPIVRTYRGIEGSRQGSFELEAFSRDGAKLFRESYQYDLAAIPQRVVDSVRKNLASGATLPGLKAAYQSLKLPKYFAPIQSIVVGADGTIWLGDGNIAAPLHRWRIIDSKGIEVGSVELPWSVSIETVRSGMAWGIATDADGMQDVVRYGVKRD